MKCLKKLVNKNAAKHNLWNNLPPQKILPYNFKDPPPHLLRHPWDPLKVAVLHRWLLCKGFSIKIGLKISLAELILAVVDRWPLTQVWLHILVLKGNLKGTLPDQDTFFLGRKGQAPSRSRPFWTRLTSSWPVSSQIRNPRQWQSVLFWNVPPVCGGGFWPACRLPSGTALWTRCRRSECCWSWFCKISEGSTAKNN